MRIYIAGPYSAPTQFARLMNTTAAIEAGIEVSKKGHYPFIPHLSHYVEEVARMRGDQFAYEHWMDQDRAWLLLCDGLLYLGPSRGADIELDLAKQCSMLVYFNVDEIPSADLMHPQKFEKFDWLNRVRQT